ncbi:ComF family protein [Patescibacteria group bacterium]|nr:MAG: ComF family protein [Patescibacteria group bacterium]
MIGHILRRILDALIPISSESAIARSLSEETLAELLHPMIHRDKQWIVALFPYRNPKVRALIRAIKYRGEKAPLPALGRILADEIIQILADKKTLGGWRNPLLVPIPSSSARLKSRGYNQVERIVLATLPHLEAEVTYAPDVLGREDRASQVEVLKSEREKNIAGAFSVIRPEKVSGMHVILIDDVAETGTTLSDAKRALIGAGASEVIAITLAH